MDAFCIYLFILIIIQMQYMFIAGDFPKNSFIAGVASPLGVLIITGNHILIFLF